MHEKKEEGQRFDEGKIRHELMPAYAINELAKAYTMGALKYSPHNWRKGMKWSRVIDSLKRHLNAIERGEDYDGTKGVMKEGKSGLLHAAHVAWNAITLLEYYHIYPQGDDRQHAYLNTNKIGLDIDEVLCNFTYGWHKRWEDTPHTPTTWYYDRKMKERMEEMGKTGELETFYLGLKPKISSEDLPFEPHCYVTARPVNTVITEKWLDMHGYPQRPVYTVPLGKSKVDIIKKSGIDIFVDDSFSNFIELNKEGICTFLWDAPHNQRYQVGYKRIKNLNELL